MPSSVKVEDLMTKHVITAKPETPLAEGAILLTEYGFNGLPVVDKSGHLVGLFSERSMVTNKSYAHIHTLLRLFSEMKFYKKDYNPIKEDLKEIIALKVADVMQLTVASLRPDDPIEKASVLLANPLNNPIPITDSGNKVVGILSLADLTKLYGVALRVGGPRAQIDQTIDEFIHKFRREFLVVSKTRARLWFLVSVLFTVIGFAIAMFMILRISV